MVDKSFTQTRYYDSVLNLFGTSTLNKRFLITADGTLQPNGALNAVKVCPSLSH